MEMPNLKLNSAAKITLLRSVVTYFHNTGFQMLVLLRF